MYELNFIKHVKINKLTLSIVGIAVSATAIWAQTANNIIEEVAWVVGDQPIYKSEIEEEYQRILYERQTVNGDPYCVIPEQLAIAKLYLHQADIDTIEVQESMVQQQVEQRINAIIADVGTKEKLEEYVRMPLLEYKQQMADMMRNQYRIQQVQSSITKDIKVTPSDVRRYFDRLPVDSIPTIPMQVEVQIITLNPDIPRQEIEDVKARLREFSDQVTKGERDFSTLAILYSEDPGSSQRGGEIGFMGRGHLDPEYAAVAFNLNDPKKVSKIVESQYGFHIIQLIEKRGERVNTRHILLRPHVSDADLKRSIERLDSIRADILANKFTFEEAAPFISQDKDTKNSRGVMINDASGTTQFQMSELPQEVAKMVNTMEPGQISEAFIMKDPKRDRDMVAIVKLTRRIPAHKANLSDDYQTIKGMYEGSLRAEKLKNWLTKKINDTYIRIEDGWDDCEFQHQGWLKLRKQ